MPRAKLPNTPVGWLVALAASMVGFIAGFIALAIFTRPVG